MHELKINNRLYWTYISTLEECHVYYIYTYVLDLRFYWQLFAKHTVFYNDILTFYDFCILFYAIYIE